MGTIWGQSPIGGSASQQYYDAYGAGATETTNKSLIWIPPAVGVTGDDALTGRGAQDPRTGLIWSKCLKNNAGTIQFNASTGSGWSWDATGTNNVAVGNLTAAQICFSMGNGWRFPTQKELMQAYIDGAYWNLSMSSSPQYWSATEYNSTYAFWSALYDGAVAYATKITASPFLRCVREI
jgi:hypothetical protein